MMKNAPVIWPL